MLQILPYLFFAVVILGISSRINLQQPLDLHTLVLRDIDEDAFQISIDRMWHGRSELNPMKSFSFGFYAYGWLFWLLPWLVGFFFWLQGNDAMLIFIPRLISALFGLISVVITYKTFRQFLNKDASILSASLVLLMTGFRRNTFWFHPDHMMTAFALLGFYFFTIDKSRYGKYFWRWSAAIGWAIWSKLAAIILLPVIAIYLAYGLYTKSLSWSESVKKGFISLGIIIFTYILLNPYVLHPIWFNAIKSQFFIDLYSNATNHGGDPTSITPLSIYLNVIEKYYFSRIMWLAVFLLWMIWSYFEIRKREKSPIVLLSFSWVVVAFGYMLSAIHKERQHYYLFPAMIVPLIFLAVRFLPIRKQRWIIWLAFALQGFQQSPYIIGEFSRYVYIPDSTEYKHAVGLSQEIEKSANLDGEKIVVIPNNLPFDYKTAWVPLEHVRKLYGNFTAEMVKGYKDPTRNVFFQVPDVIILTKDLPLFNLAKEEEYKKTVTYPELLASRKFFFELTQGRTYEFNGKSYSYQIVKDDREYIILEKVSK